MRTRRFFHFETPDIAQRRALNEQLSATTYMSLLEDRSLMPLYYGLFAPAESERATAHLQMVFDKLYCKLDRLCDEKHLRPVRRRSMAIRWEEIDGPLLEINVNFCATHE